MLDFGRYFLPEQHVFLENINYELVRPEKRTGQLKLNCKDTIVARILDPLRLKITFNRAISFEPEGLFYLSVSFSSILRFNPETKDEIDWTKIDLAGEFRKNGGFLMHNLASRASLLVAQISSASGQPPIITAPGIPRFLISDEEQN